MMRPERWRTIGLSAACVKRERGRQVGADHGVPVVALHAQQQPVARDAGVVDQNVDAPVPLEDAGHRRLDRRRVGHLERDRLRRVRRPR